MMKKETIKRLSTLILVCITVTLILTGCDEKPIPKDTELDSLKLMEGTTLTQTLDVPGEDFKLVIEYDTGRYDFSNWRITSNKYINMSAHISSLPEGTTVLVDHMHVDIALQSTSPQVDGMLQDSMDNSYNGTSQDGYYIDENYCYRNQFIVEGYSQTLINGWGFVCGSYGSSSINEERLTEENLLDENNGGVYGNKIQAEYKLLVKHAGEEYFHNTSVMSEFSIPVVSHDTSSEDEYTE